VDRACLREFVLAHDDALSTLSDAELVEAYADAIQSHDMVKHIGRRNRLMDRRFEILAALQARDGTLQLLRPLLNHPHPGVQLSAAYAFRNIDRLTSERILGGLAKRSDHIGFEARLCLQFPAESEQERKSGRSGTPSPFDWQADHPPPAAMTFARIMELLNEEFPADRAARLARLARAAVGLWPQRPRPNLPLTASRFGGMPYAPANWRWPLCEAEPMFFLGQINCADLQGLPGAERLPASGLLAFFGDHDAVMSGTRHGDSPVAVYHWSDLHNLVPAKPPLEVQIVFPLCGISFWSFIDLPDPFSDIIESVAPKEGNGHYLDVWEAMREHGLPRGMDSYCAFSKLFGWPDWQQGDLVGMGDPGEAETNGLHLLLQIDSYSNGTESAEWGDRGSLYFLIRTNDLQAGRFERCEFEMQCG
jgi:hypothetical protein